MALIPTMSDFRWYKDVFISKVMVREDSSDTKRGAEAEISLIEEAIIEHFIGTPSELRSRIHDQLSNLRCPTMSDFRWYKDVFISKVMVREDSSALFWKEKFINGLPSLFAHKIKQVLVNEDNIIEYDNFT